MTPRRPRTVAEPIRRRVLGAAAGAWLLVPRTPLAQRERRRLGYLRATPFVAHGWRANPVMHRLSELAWNEGGNLDIEQARGNEEEIPALAEAPVRRHVALIFAIGPEAAVGAARDPKLTPLVFWEVPMPARAQALAGGPVAFIHRSGGRFASLARRHRLPTATDGLQFVDAGWVVACAPHLLDSARRAAEYFDRVLRGMPPAALPVELPARHELALNLATARAIGVTVLDAVLMQAEWVVE